MGDFNQYSEGGITGRCQIDTINYKIQGGINMKTLIDRFLEALELTDYEDEAEEEDEEYDGDEYDES